MGARAMGERGFQTILLYRALQLADPTREPCDGATVVSEALASNVRDHGPWATYMEILHRLMSATSIPLAEALHAVVVAEDLSAESKIVRVGRTLHEVVQDGVDALRDGADFSIAHDQCLLGYDTTIVKSVRLILAQMRDTGEINPLIDCEEASFILYALVIASLFDYLHGTEQSWPDVEHRLRVLIGIVFRYWKPRALRSTG